MLRRFLICGMLLAACQPTFGEDKPADKEVKTKVPTSSKFEKMAKLAGTWVMADKDGKPTDEVVSEIRLTAGGSAIQETFFPGKDMEMVSFYTADGDEIEMTHYCVIGNQPRMKSVKAPAENEIKFAFVGGSNLDPKKDKHMHEATLKIVSNDKIVVQGIGWEDGKPAKEMCGDMTLVRKK